jgi:hypothetical protein
MTRQIGFSAAALIAAALTAGGCTQAPAPPQAKPKTSASKADDHNHTHDGDNHHEHGAGPHEGTLADWGGGKYHVEFTVDHDKKESLVYLLGADMKTPAPVKTADGKLLLTIKEPAFQVELAARPLPGENDGRASCYGGSHESLGIVREFAGTISGEVDGTPFAGDFAEEAHGDHDHK